MLNCHAKKLLNTLGIKPFVLIKWINSIKHFSFNNVSCLIKKYENIVTFQNMVTQCFCFWLWILLTFWKSTIFDWKNQQTENTLIYRNGGVSNTFIRYEWYYEIIQKIITLWVEFLLVSSGVRNSQPFRWHRPSWYCCIRDQSPELPACASIVFKFQHKTYFHFTWRIREKTKKIFLSWYCCIRSCHSMIISW